MSKQDIDFEWFIENNSKLYKKHGNKFLAIKDKKVIGIFDSYSEAVNQTSQKEKLGSFIIQECGKDESVYTTHIASMFFK